MQYINNNKGFTLVEMLVVLLIISVLIMITIPNVKKHFTTIDEKGCDGYIKMMQGQVEAYKLSVGTYPTTFEDLEKAEYVSDKVGVCPDKTTLLTIDNGTVKRKDAK